MDEFDRTARKRMSCKSDLVFVYFVGRNVIVHPARTILLKIKLQWRWGTAKNEIILPVGFNNYLHFLVYENSVRLVWLISGVLFYLL